MKTNRNNLGARRGWFRVVDLLFGMMAVLLVLAFVLPAVTKPKLLGGPSCTGNLKQIGVVFRLWANDNEGQFPMAVSTNQGGTLEYAQAGQVFRNFLATSNHLYSPKVLVCPADKERARLSEWTAGFTNLNLSYFAGLDADEACPQTILTGDRHITGGVLTIGDVMLFRSNSAAKWTRALHNQSGNVALSDGSVLTTSEESLQARFVAQMEALSNEVVRLAIP